MAFSAASLPAYTHPDIPSYTAQPRGGEQTLGQSRARRYVDPSNYRDWTMKHGPVTLTLVDQPVGSDLPIYGRETEVRGSVTVHSRTDVSKVSLRLHGYVKCKTIAEIGEAEIIVLDLPVVLWQGNGTGCPEVLPFEVPIPGTFTSESRTEALPPTFEYIFYDVQAGTPGLKFKIKYELFVEVEHAHTSLKDKLSSTLSTNFIYYPRTRPAAEPSRVPSSVFEAVMERRVGKSREEDPIMWKLRLPPPGTYPLNPSIPFRVTVTSRSSAQISQFAPSNKRDRAMIRVYVLRQVSIKVNSVDLWRSYVIGEGQLKYAPSIDDIWLKNIVTRAKTSSDSLGSSAEAEGWATHEWEGEVKVKDEVSVGGFRVGDMSVKDFIVLSVVPPNPRLGNLLEVKRVVPIQLTTDEYVPGYTPAAAPQITPPRMTTTTTSQQANSDTSSDAGFLEGRGDGHHIENPSTNGNGVYRNGATNAA